MIGGSASPQTSGAPFRTESDHGASGWPPPPAHQNDLFNRGFGIYSFFPGIGDDAKTMYTATATATAAKSGTSFPGFLEPKKVPNSFFPAKYPFTPDGSTQFDSASNSIFQPSIAPRLDLGGKSPFVAANPDDSYIGTTKVHCEPQTSDSAKRKSSSDDVIVIKSEIEEGQKEVKNCGHFNGGGGDDVDKVGNLKNGENDAAGIQVGQKNEADSTVSRIPTRNHGNEEITSTGSDINSNKPSTCLNGKEVCSRGKCDVKVVDLSLHGSSVEVKGKMPDSSCSKGLTVNCRPFGSDNMIASKPSPTGRTLSLSSNNGGCSRTTPITFKHMGQSEPADSKPEVGNRADALTPVVSIKMEPVEFPKHPNNSPFLGYAPINNLFDPSGLRVLDRQIINSVPYPGSFDGYSRQREKVLNSSNSEENFLRSSHDFLSSRPEPSDNGYLSPKMDAEELNSFKSCHGLTKIGKGCVSPNDERERKKPHEGGSLVNSTTSEFERKNASSATGSNVTPCQVAEVTSASSMLSPKTANPVVIKEEAVSVACSSNTPSTDQKTGFLPPGQSTAVSSTVGMSLVKPICEPRIEEMKMSPLNPSSPQSSILRRTVPSPTSINMPPTIGAAVYSGGIVCEDRSTSIWPAQTHNAGLWQYSAAIDYPAFPPVGFQLVRDPITGHFLLIPASNLEALQRAILWPTYAPATSPMILPPISLQPSAPRLLLDTTNVSAVNFLTSEGVRRTATPQHRILVPGENITTKRKVVGPALIKFEGSESSGTGVAASCKKNDNAYEKNSSPGLLPRPENREEFSQLPTIERGQAESSVGSPTPVLLTQPSRTFSPETGLQHKPNSENDGSHFRLPVSPETEPIKQVDDKLAVQKEIEKRKETKSRQGDGDVLGENIKQETISPSSQVDLSGLELLSNSIERLMFEKIDGDLIKTEERERLDVDKKELSNDACEGAVLLQNLKNRFWDRERAEEYEESGSKALGGLGLLCALAEQRFQEEIVKCEKVKEEQKDGDENDEEEKKKDGEEEENGAICERMDVECSVRHQESKDCDFNRNYHSEREYLVKGVNLDDEKATNQKVRKPYQTLLMKNLSSDVENSSDKKGDERLNKVKEEMSAGRISPEERNSRKSRDISPPVLERQTDYPTCKQEDDSDDDLDEDDPNGRFKPDSSKPPTLTPEKSQLDIGNKKLIELECSEGENRKRKISDSNIGGCYSSKKRKVGRPKKHNLPNGNEIYLTETIVAKKVKIKSSYQYSSGNNDVTSVGKHNAGSPPLYDERERFDKEEKVKKIKPKLKAEPKVRESSPALDECTLEDWRKEEDEDEGEETENEEDVTENEDEIEQDKKPEEKEIRQEKESNIPSCVLTGEHIKSEKCPVRTLTAMGGLFYAGQLSAIRAPDVYGITIDGERGNRPHIYSREEILRDTILEVKPEKATDLVPGTRCCAYWSEQYRCLYPGTVSVATSPDPDPDDRFVNVEFDDGDSGKINIDDIRFLPNDYPIVEYDPNPLQSLSKRRRRISGASVESHSKERKSLENQSNEAERPEESRETKEEKSNNEESMDFVSLDSEERKHLRKKRREKLKRLQSLSSIEKKKKHKKHRCSDEHRHHKHHKKHRKHKHKHGMKSGSGEPETETEKLKIKKEDKNKCKVGEKISVGKPKKCKERTDSVESRSKMAAFLPARQLWGWSGKGYKRPGAKGRAKKEFYKTIQRGKERITVGDCAVFLSTGRPDRPYIGRIESMWESWSTNMIVKVKWFYHPEETVGCPATLEYPGALFESPHVDENDVQTISHKCEVLPLKEYTAKLGNSPRRYEAVYDNNDVYYLAGYYDPTNLTLKMEPGVK